MGRHRVTETFLDFAGGQVRVLWAGRPAADPADPTLLLIHGGGSDNSAISWSGLFSPLAEEWPTVAIDLPGFGGTTGIDPVGGPDALARFLIGVLDRLGLGRVICLGVSMGGDVALNLARIAPDRVGGLVLIAPGGLVPIIRNRRTQFAAWLATRLPDPVLLPLTRIANRFTRQALRAMVRHPERLPEDLVAEFVREARRPGAGIAYGRYNQATVGWNRMRNNLLPVVHLIRTPTLIVHGTDDPLVDPEGSVRAAQLMPCARLVTVEDCGHWVQVERPAEFLEVALPWLRRLRVGRQD